MNVLTITTNQHYDIKKCFDIFFKKHWVHDSMFLQYVGCTVRMQHVSLKEPIANFKRGYSGHYPTKHFARYYNKDLTGTLIFGYR